ncbi:RecF/RecN/SMC N terminal domain-containing protein [Flavobacterium segetis]|uniref:RecF/RecN/SMC N terminal domain-containing protein n=1 Tax=Flavobacterium segetis TaxID=271157 RepID=A0A1M5JMD4_9FLAO|nr:AAA family ATPase [Flavobacterium segetis]SHG41193.1 RecF/RecN/SMC N terminal domain-containing protein [Flavobacterium segetis]
MGIRIKKIEIQNFKIYKNQPFDFEGNSLVVLDGPNGFGKTSLYDALELLFTGKIRRYEKATVILNDKREKRKENPFYHSDGDGSPIIIKALIEFNGVQHVLARKNSNIVETKIDFSHFKLHKLTDFDESIEDSNLVSEDYLRSILGNNYKNDFQFVNYVEQEETFYYLKSSERDKKDGISYLFNTSEFDNEIERINKVSNKINNLLNGENGLTKKIEDSVEIIFSLEESFKPIDGVSYEKLFENKDFIWDKDEIDFNSICYNEIFGEEDGTVFRLEKFIKDKNDFLAEVNNSKISEIVSKESLIVSLLKYEHFRDSEEEILIQKNIINSFNKFKIKFESFQIDEILKDTYDLPELILSKLDGNEIVGAYVSKLKILKTYLSSSNQSSKIIANLITTKNKLSEHLIEYHNKLKEDGICPFCGYDWETNIELIKNIEKQKDDFEQLNKDIDQTLKENLESFIQFTSETLLEEVDAILSGFLYKSEFFEDDFFDLASKRSLSLLKLDLHDFDFDYSKFILSEVKNEYDGNIESFIESLKFKLEDYDVSAIQPYYAEYYSHYFDSKRVNLDDLSLKMIDNKRKYIEWSYSLFQSSLLKLKKEELNLLRQKQEKLLIPFEKIKNILGIMNNSLSWYNSQLIKDIEVLFHIYSGRIVQDFQGGLGLFIINRGDRVKFVTTPEKTYDAVFSMSTGQLSALVLSFTLALNKKYSKSKLLLIDDPVQSMDDINTAGFVEVLRNDFSDRQIVFSTHEHSMSTYLRYKFKKFDIDSTRIDLSNLKQ